MDIQPQKNQSQSISDDQDLAKVLSGVSTEPDAPEPAPTMPTPTQMPQNPQVATAPAPDEPAKDQDQTGEAQQPVGYNPPEEKAAQTEPAPQPEEPEESGQPAEPAPAAPAPSNDGSLDSIKKDALKELRPLVGKLNLPPEEQFDTYLLLLRSTDDKALIAPAHEAAQNITDESKKAQALLEIIKEIDFLSSSQAASSENQPEQPAPTN
jgi:hypothetical protein